MTLVLEVTLCDYTSLIKDTIKMFSGCVNVGAHQSQSLNVREEFLNYYLTFPISPIKSTSFLVFRFGTPFCFSENLLYFLLGN